MSSLPKFAKALLLTVGVFGTIVIGLSLWFIRDYIVYALDPPTREWAQISQSGPVRVYLDTNNISHRGDYLKYQILIDFYDRLTIADVKSVQLSVELDCANKLRLVNLIGPSFTGPMGTGKIVVNAKPPSGPLESMRSFGSYSHETSLVREQYILCKQ